MLLVVVGMPASGKNIARDFAEANNIPYFASGDVVRNEVKKRGLTPDAKNTGEISTQLRGQDGMGVTRIVLASAMASSEDVVFVEGMRSWPEVELIRDATDCKVIAFVAPRDLRRQRIIARGRADDSPDAFDERDMREISYGASIPVALADAYVLNTKSMDDALADLGHIVELFKKTPRTHQGEL